RRPETGERDTADESRQDAESAGAWTCACMQRAGVGMIQQREAPPVAAESRRDQQAHKQSGRAGEDHGAKARGFRPKSRIAALESNTMSWFMRSATAGVRLL